MQSHPHTKHLTLSSSLSPHWLVSLQCVVLGLELNQHFYSKQTSCESKHKLCFAFSGPALHFENPPQHIQAEVGKTARVTCFFNGTRPIVSCWIRNKEQVL